MKKIMNINGFFYWDKYNTTDVYLPRKIYPFTYRSCNRALRLSDVRVTFASLNASEIPLDVFLLIHPSQFIYLASTKNVNIKKIQKLDENNIRKGLMQ